MSLYYKSIKIWRSNGIVYAYIKYRVLNQVVKITQEGIVAMVTEKCARPNRQAKH